MNAQSYSKKAYYICPGDRVGSRINEDLFVYAYCEKQKYFFSIILDPWEYTDELSEKSRVELHSDLIEFLGLPQTISREFKPVSNDWIQIRDEYLNVDVASIFTEEFISKLRQNYKYKKIHSNESNKKTVSIHVRRGDVDMNNERRYMPNQYYIDLIHKIRQYDSDVIINVFSDTAYQREKKIESLEIFRELGCNLYVDLDIIKTWQIMIDSEILVMAKSSFSWVPALYNNNFVIYPECWLNKMNHWISRNDSEFENKLKLFLQK